MKKLLAAAILLSSIAALAFPSIAASVELLPLDRQSGDAVGYSVSIHNGNAFVASAPDLANFGGRLGSVYLFDEAGQQIRQYTTFDALAYGGLGASIASDGTVLIVGAPGRGPVNTIPGAAYVFDVATGAQIAALHPNDGAPHDVFGWKVALNSTHYLVSSMLNDSAGETSGAIYLFDRVTGAQQKILALDASPGQRFGTDVALNDTWAVIGASEDSAQALFGGSAYILNLADRSMKKLVSKTPHSLGQYGYSVAIDGDRVLVGSLFERGSPVAGVAYLYDAVTGNLVQEFLPDDPNPLASFGETVAISGKYVAVGAVRDSTFGENTGAVYLFDAATGEQLRKLTLPMPAAQDSFGWDLAIEGNHLLVSANARSAGAPYTGAAYLFTIPEPTSVLLALPLIVFFRPSSRRLLRAKVRHTQAFTAGRLIGQMRA
jgi:outer membrane protein assembly factor BamB